MRLEDRGSTRRRNTPPGHLDGALLRAQERKTHAPQHRHHKDAHKNTRHGDVEHRAPRCDGKSNPRSRQTSSSPLTTNAIFATPTGGNDGYWLTGTCSCCLTRRWAWHRCHSQLWDHGGSLPRRHPKDTRTVPGKTIWGESDDLASGKTTTLRHVHARHGRRGGKSSRNCKCFRYFPRQNPLTSPPRIFNVSASLQRPVLIRPNMCSFSSSMAWSPFTSAPRSATH